MEYVSNWPQAFAVASIAVSAAFAFAVFMWAMARM